jgi:polysaccharide biosynthesis/export protein/SLBB domain-containing protein
MPSDCRQRRDRTAGLRRAVVRGATLAAIALGPALGSPAAAQQAPAWDWHDLALTRAQLTQLLARYQAAAASPAYGAATRERAGASADSIRARLKGGDMRIGDRLRLTVEGQQALTDTFAVSAGPALVLPTVGRVDLTGALRSELEERIAGRVDSVYRDAVVHVRALTRVAVMGGVVRPGFYALPSDALIADVIGATGGVSPDAQLDKVYVERGRDRLYPADSILVAMRTARTIGDLGLEDGDRVVVPVNPPGATFQTVQSLSYLLSLGLSLFTLARVL